MAPEEKLSVMARDALIATLEKRFEENMQRHRGLKWADVLARLEAAPDKLWSLNEMEYTEGEPDVVGQVKETGEFIFMDCATESPKGRRSLCFDRAAWDARKENKPASSAAEMAEAMGVTLLTEEEYGALQRVGEFDLKTSSWLTTPAAMRERGGALFGDRRFGRVFYYHNGADSYYAARGFRGVLRV